MKENLVNLMSPGLFLIVIALISVIFVFYINKLKEKINIYKLAIIRPFETVRDNYNIQILHCIMNICAVRMSDIASVTTELMGDIKSNFEVGSVIESQKYELLIRLFRRHQNTDSFIVAEIDRANELIRQSIGEDFLYIDNPTEYREGADQMNAELKKALEDLQRILKEVSGKKGEVLKLLESTIPAQEVVNQ